MKKLVHEAMKYAVTPISDFTLDGVFPATDAKMDGRPNMKDVSEFVTIKARGKKAEITFTYESYSYDEEDVDEEDEDEYRPTAMEIGFVFFAPEGEPFTDAEYEICSKEWEAGFALQVNINGATYNVEGYSSED